MSRAGQGPSYSSGKGQNRFQEWVSRVGQSLPQYLVRPRMEGS